MTDAQLLAAWDAAKAECDRLCTGEPCHTPEYMEARYRFQLLSVKIGRLNPKHMDKPMTAVEAARAFARVYEEGK